MSTARPDFQLDGSTVYATQETVNYLKPILESLSERHVDKVQTIERHIGRFNTPADVKRWMATRDGGIRLAALNVPSFELIGGRLVGSVNMVAYVFTTDAWGYAKDTRAEVIVSKLVRAMVAKNAPPTAYSRAQNFRANNLYTSALDELGLALWTVEWSQQWYLDVPIDPTTLDDFITFGLRGEVAEGAPEIEGEVQLPQ
ncbi:hypothetical protein DDN98_13195 [Vibrio cholerae]|nr:hypothetical protein [Vibrio cholerae]EGR4298554.1 hypothetical protein [Vibrio cholerae]